MHHWKETSEIVTRMALVAKEGRSAAIATVVRVEGSAYRRPGAKMLIEESGETLGGVSGGCLEADVCEVAKTMMSHGHAVLRHYDQTLDDPVTGLGMGCKGVVDILVQTADEWPLASLRSLLAGDAPVAITTDLASGGTTAGVAGEGARTGVEGGVFTEVLEPPRHLIICGAGSDTSPIVGYASDVGFRVTVLDHRTAYPEDPEIVLPPAARTLAVVKTRSLAHDRAWVRLFVGIGVPYIGVLGPRERTEKILREVCDTTNIPSVFGPVGLDLGAEGPHQVAMSIVAELLAFVSGREPRHLWQRHRGIHEE
jgi:xanthine dehydrogenase accessory factor